MKLFNVVVRAVDLIWAESPEDAILRFGYRLDNIGVNIMPDGNDAFVSEAVPEMGWAGE